MTPEQEKYKNKNLRNAIAENCLIHIIFTFVCSSARYTDNFIFTKLRTHLAEIMDRTGLKFLSVMFKNIN